MEINPSAKQLMTILEANGYEAYVVGGCVRDMLRGQTPKDWDIATNALPQQMLEVFRDYHVIPTGLRHGTVTVLLNREALEVTTYRTGAPASSLYADLARRDFTINAMAYHPQTGLVDPFHGLADLRAQIIRAVGDASERFHEDALRMLRCVRFSVQLGAEIDAMALDAIGSHGHLLQTVSVERIREEMNKILVSAAAGRGMNLLYDSGLLTHIVPELCRLIDFDQRNPHHHKDVWKHTLIVLDAVRSTVPLRWAALLHDIGKPATFSIGSDHTGHFHEHHKVGADLTREILLRLKFDHDTVEKVGILVYNHMFRHDKLRDASVKKFINRVGIDNLDDLFELQIADIKGCRPPHDFRQIEDLRAEVNRILAAHEPLSLQNLKISGDDLIAAGFEPGKTLGDTLRYLLEAVLNNPGINEKEILLAMAEKFNPPK